MVFSKGFFKIIKEKKGKQKNFPLALTSGICQPLIWKQPASILYRQMMAAFLTAALYHSAAVMAFHPFAKTIGSLSFLFFGLIGSFRHIVSLKEKAKSCNWYLTRGFLADKFKV